MQLAPEHLGPGGVPFAQHLRPQLGDPHERGPAVGGVRHPLRVAGASSRLTRMVMPGWVIASRAASSETRSGPSA